MKKKKMSREDRNEWIRSLHEKGTRQQDIADMVGLSIQSVNKIIKKFKQHKQEVKQASIVQQNPKKKIEDMGKLVEVFVGEGIEELRNRLGSMESDKIANIILEMMRIGKG